MNKLFKTVSSKKMILIACVILIAIGYAAISKKEVTHTKASNASEKFFTSITVEPGDTLWSIADQNMTEEYSSTKEYIEEVKKINSLDTEEIIAGTTLVIPYYEIENY